MAAGSIHTRNPFPFEPFELFRCHPFIILVSSKHRRLLDAVHPTYHHVRSFIASRSSPHIWALTPLDSMCSSSGLVDFAIAYCHDRILTPTRSSITPTAIRPRNHVGDPLRPHHQCGIYHHRASSLAPAACAAAIHDSCPRDRPRRSNRIQNGDRAKPWQQRSSPARALVRCRFRPC